MAGCLIADALTYQRQGRDVFSPQSFSLRAGEGLCLQGRNGSGKSTLLKILSGLLMPSSGQLCWQGQAITRSYQNQVAYVGHASGLKSGLTIEENWTCALAIHQHLSELPFQTLLSCFELPAHTRVADLSAGQQQKAALAKLKLIPKPIWLLDEPDTALDGKAKTLVHKLMHEHLHQGGILIISSHTPPQLQMKVITL